MWSESLGISGTKSLLSKLRFKDSLTPLQVITTKFIMSFILRLHKKIRLFVNFGTTLNWFKENSCNSMMDGLYKLLHNDVIWPLKKHFNAINWPSIMLQKMWSNIKKTSHRSVDREKHDVIIFDIMTSLCLHVPTWPSLKRRWQINATDTDIFLDISKDGNLWNLLLREQLSRGFYR